MRIVNIRNIDVYKDGGTLSIRCFGYPGDDHSKITEFEICLDGRMRFGADIEPHFWIGYPGKVGSVKIEDRETINYIKGEVSDFHKYLTFSVEKILNSNG